MQYLVAYVIQSDSSLFLLVPRRGFPHRIFLGWLEAKARPGNLICAHCQWRFFALGPLLGKRERHYNHYSLESLGVAGSLSCASVVKIQKQWRVARASHPLFFKSSKFTGVLVLSSRNFMVTNSTIFGISISDIGCACNWDYCHTSPKFLDYLLGMVAGRVPVWTQLITVSIALCLMMSFPSLYIVENKEMYAL